MLQALCAMSTTIVVDLGSSAVKCGLAHTYLTDTQPAVVRTRSECTLRQAVVPWLVEFQCAFTSMSCTRCMQVTSSHVSSASEPLGGQQSLGSIQVIRDGQVADWAGLERILYDALYMQVRKLVLCDTVTAAVMPQTG